MMPEAGTGGEQRKNAARLSAEDYESGNGAQGRNRTTDTAIFSRMLYQLSYLGGAPAGASPGGEARGL